jgi:hypothetical protein
MNPREAKPFTRFHGVPRSPKQLLGEVRVLFTLQNAPLTPTQHPARLRRIPAFRIRQDRRQHGRLPSTITNQCARSI